MRQVPLAVMASGSGIDPDDHFQEPVHGQRDNSNVATSPSDGDGAPPPSAVAPEGGADAPSPSPPPAAPVDRPQELVLQQAGSGSGGTNGSSSAAAGAADQKGKKPASPSPPRSDGRSPSTSPSSSDSDCKDVFEKLVRQAEKKKPEQEQEQEQVKSSHPKKSLWSKCKSLLSRKKKIDGEGRLIDWEHVDHQTLPITEARKHYRATEVHRSALYIRIKILDHRVLGFMVLYNQLFRGMMFSFAEYCTTLPITEVGNRYRATEDWPILLNLGAFSRIRPVLGDGECFYRSFIYSYLEQVLDRQDTHEEQRLLYTVKRVSKKHRNLGWTTEFRFRRSYKAFKKLIKKIMEWKSEGTSNSYRKEELLEFFRTYDTTDDIFVFLRLLVGIHICSHSGQYGDLIRGIYGFKSLKNWCLRFVTKPRVYTDHVMMTALATALGVTLRLERLYGRGSDEDNMYTGPGAVTVTLLYTGMHYDIIYPRAPSAESLSRQASQGEDPAG